MGITQFRRFLLDRGMVAFYAIFIAGYFLLPMASGHRNLYYLLMVPAVLVLWREQLDFYRGNLLAGLLLAYTFYMMCSLAWTIGFDPASAAAALGYSISVLTFCFISGYLWLQYPATMDRLAHRAIWLAAAAALVAIIAWYLDHPFPESRLEPLGVMHHQNKAACAYGIFLLLCIHYTLTERGREHRATHLVPILILLSLILLTQSRTALAATCVAMLVLMGSRAIGILAVGVAASFALLAATPQLWQQRVMTLSFRPGIWEQVVADLPGSLLFGQGYLVDPRVAAYDRVFSHAHNGYLASLRDGGLIGLALLLALLVVATAWAWQLFRLRGERIYLALLLYGMTCIAMDFDRLLVHPKELWLFFWLPLALTMAAHRQCVNGAPVRYPGGSA